MKSYLLIAAATAATLAPLAVAPAEAMVIGDSANDAEGARAAGCRVLLVTYGYNEGRDVRGLDADGVVATLGEAVDLLLAPTS
jgi:phosphoglycolate phosphatase